MFEACTITLYQANGQLRFPAPKAYREMPTHFDRANHFQIHGQNKPKFIVTYYTLMLLIQFLAILERKQSPQKIYDLVFHKHLYFIDPTSAHLFPVVLSQLSPFSIIAFVPFILHFF